MSRKLVLVGVFLAVLPVLLVSVKAREGDPPKKEAIDADGSLSDARGAKSEKLKPANDPFSADESKRPGKPKVDLAKTKPSQPDGLKTAAQEVACDEAAEGKIRAALASKTQIEFVETPLKDVVDYLKDLHHIEIQLDTSALKEAGVDESTQVTKNLKGISLRSALKLVLDEVQLKYVVHHGVLLITSTAKAESDEFMQTRCYPVEDLVLPEDDGCANFTSLNELLTATVATKSWTDNGGTGTLFGFVAGNRPLLVVSQSEEVHEQIENMLEKLRKAGGLKTAAQRVAAEDREGPKSSNVASPQAKVMRLKQRQDACPVVSGGGMGAELKEMRADAGLNENLQKRIDFLNSRIAAMENLLVQTSDAGKRETLLREYSEQVKALKDLFEARAALKSMSAAAQGTHRQ
jgi:hypothetical protein